MNEHAFTRDMDPPDLATVEPNPELRREWADRYGAGVLKTPPEVDPEELEPLPEDPDGAIPFYSGDTFADATLPTREVLATNEAGDPLLRRRMIVAIGAHRGVGKTMATSLGLSVAASLGEGVFTFRWVRPLRVLVLDLELPAAEMQERYRRELRGRQGSSNWRLISSDGLDDPVGCLHSPHEVARLMPHYEWADVIVIDSATYGLTTDDDNSAAHWKPCEDFLFMLRRMDKLVVANFHLNAQGTKIRGTTAKEQSADLVALLRRPTDGAEDGVHFTWGWTKRRGVTAAVAKDFETRFDPATGWATTTVDDTDRRAAFLDLLRAGMPVNEAAEEAAISRATAYRWRAELIETGLLGKPPGWDKRRGRRS